MNYLVLPGKLLHEEMEDSEAQRLRGSTGLLPLLESTSSFSSSSCRKPLDKPERRHSSMVGKKHLEQVIKTSKMIQNSKSESTSAVATGCLNNL